MCRKEPEHDENGSKPGVVARRVSGPNVPATKLSSEEVRKNQLNYANRCAEEERKEADRHRYLEGRRKLISDYFKCRLCDGSSFSGIWKHGHGMSTGGLKHPVQTYVLDGFYCLGGCGAHFHDPSGWTSNYAELKKALEMYDSANRPEGVSVPSRDEMWPEPTVWAIEKLARR